MQIASVTGIYGVSFAVVAVNAGLAELWLAVRGRGLAAARGAGRAPARRSFRRVWRSPTAWSRSPERAGTESDGAVPVAIVQGNIDSGSRWRSDLYGANLELYLRLTLDTFEEGSPEIVFWPEAAMTFFVDEEPLYRKAIGSVLRRGGVELVAGAPRYEKGPDGPLYYNSIFLFSEDGEIRGRYDKQYPVPFTEYFPLRVDFLRRRFGRARELTPGGPTPPLPTRAGPAGVVTCNEAMLPEVVSRRVDAGRRLPGESLQRHLGRRSPLLGDAVRHGRWCGRSSSGGTWCGSPPPGPRRSSIPGAACRCVPRSFSRGRARRCGPAAPGALDLQPHR